MRQHRLLLAGILSLAACSANWQPVALPQPQPLDSRTVVEFYAGDHLVRLHGVQFSRDSVSGIPWLEHLSCDTCRVSYALAGASQLRTGNPGAGAWIILGPVIGLMLFLTGVSLAFASLGGT